MKKKSIGETVMDKLIDDVKPPVDVVTLSGTTYINGDLVVNGNLTITGTLTLNGRK